MEMEEKEYIKENIRMIKKYLKELSKLDYNNIDLPTAIILEHRLFFDIYEPFMKIIKGSDRNEKD